MSDDEGVRLSRRSVLAGTAALGFAGTSTAVARQFDSGTVTDFDADASIEWDETGWPRARYDNGNTNYNLTEESLTGELKGGWSRDWPSFNDEPIVADGMVYTITDWPASGAKLRALDAEDGSKQWAAELEPRHHGSLFTTDNLVVADGVVYLSRRYRTVAFDAADGTKLWTVENGGENIVVTDELVVTATWKYTSDRTWTVVEALSREDGAVEWEQTIDEVSADGLAGVGDSLYVSASQTKGGKTDMAVYSLALDSGELEWSTATTSGKGLGYFLAATEDMVFQSAELAVVALDAETGDERWRKEVEQAEDDGYWTTAVRAVGDGLAYTVVEDTLYAFDAETGEETWSVEYGDNNHSVVVVGDVLYYVVGWEEDPDSADPDGYDQLVLHDAETGERLATHQVPDVSGERDDGDSRIEGFIAPVEGAIYAHAEGNLVQLLEKSDDSGDEQSDEDGNSDEDQEGGEGDHDNSNGDEDDC